MEREEIKQQNNEELNEELLKEEKLDSVVNDLFENHAWLMNELGK